MADGVRAIAQEVRQRLQRQKWSLLSESDLRRHLPRFRLSRSTGNQLCQSLIALNERHCLGVETFVRPDNKVVAIQLLVARDMATYLHGRETVHNDFEARNGPTDELLNLHLHMEHH